MSPDHNETFSRVLIDKALEFSEWDLLAFVYNAVGRRPAFEGEL